MISIDFINSGYTGLYTEDYCDSFLLYLNESEKDISLLNISYKTNISKILMESSIMDTNPEEYRPFIETENKNFVEKIGAALIDLAKKFNEMIDKLIDKIKDFAFKFKSNEKKMDLLVRQHPELGKEKIKVLCDQGGLDFSDINSLSKLNSSFEEILRMTKEANVDPKSLKGKWEAAKKKCFGDDYKAKGALVTAGTVLTVALAVKKFKPELVQWKSKLSKIRDEEKVLDAKAYDAIKKDNGEIENAGWASTILAINRERKQLHAKAIGQQQSAVDKLVNSIAKGVDSLVGSSAGKAVLGDKSAALRTDLTNAKSKADAAERETEYNKKRGSLQAEKEDRRERATEDQNNSDEGANARRNNEARGRRSNNRGRRH